MGGQGVKGSAKGGGLHVPKPPRSGVAETASDGTRASITYNTSTGASQNALIMWITIGAIICVIGAIVVRVMQRKKNTATTRLHDASTAARRANDFAAVLGEEALVRVAPTQLVAAATTAAAAGPLRRKQGADPAQAQARGLGLFSVRPVALGQCLLSEPPLFTSFSGTQMDLDAAWSKLDIARQDDVMTLEDSTMPGRNGEKSVQGIMATNAMPGSTEADAGAAAAGQAASSTKTVSSPSLSSPLSPGSSHATPSLTTAPTQPMNGTGSVFLMTSRANHSCTPTAEYVWDSRQGRGLLFPCPQAFFAPGASAVGAPSTGLPNRTEITISYIDSWKLDFLQRRRLLAQQFGFECRCESCRQSLAGDLLTGGARSEDRIASDANRRRIASLDALLPTLGSDPARASDVATHLIQLLAEEGFAHSAVTARVHAIVYQLIGDKEGYEQQALAHARQAAAGFEAHRGKNSDVAVEARRIVQRAEKAKENITKEEEAVVAEDSNVAVPAGKSPTSPAAASKAEAAAEDGEETDAEEIEVAEVGGVLRRRTDINSHKQK